MTLDTTDIFTSTFATDSGSAIPASNISDVRNGSNIVTLGSGFTITASLSSSPSFTNLTVQNITVTTSETFGNLGQGVVQSSSSGVISSSEGTDGNLLIASSSGAPAWANIIAGSNISIVNAANSVTINQGLGMSGLTLIATGYLAYTNIPSTYKTLLLIGNFSGIGNLFQRVSITLSSNNGTSYYTNYQSGLNYFISDLTPSGDNGNFTSSSSLIVTMWYATGGVYFCNSFAAWIYNANSTTSPIMVSSYGATGGSKNLKLAMSRYRHMYEYDYESYQCITDKY